MYSFSILSITLYNFLKTKRIIILDFFIWNGPQCRPTRVACRSKNHFRLTYKKLVGRGENGINLLQTSGGFKTPQTFPKINQIQNTPRPTSRLQSSTKYLQKIRGSRAKALDLQIFCRSVSRATTLTCESNLVQRRLLYHFQKFTKGKLCIFAIFMKSINWIQ